MERRLRLDPNLRGAIRYPPGHFYSPLLDIQAIEAGQSSMPFDGPEWWENIDLRPGLQRSYYHDLLAQPRIDFPAQRSQGYRYFSDNRWFVLPDAFTLSAVMRRERPRRIVEVGSGFSSAVMLDTVDRTDGLTTKLVFIEIGPDRLHSLLTPDDIARSTLLVQRVQEVAETVFDELEGQDILFIDSSHVAKVGSDVAFLLLRVLPRLKRGVLVHVHDIVYPFSYPITWMREGRAWNESLFLRAFLLGNLAFEIIAFNSFAAQSFPDIFRGHFPDFLSSVGGSIWLRKVA